MNTKTIQIIALKRKGKPLYILSDNGKFLAEFCPELNEYLDKDLQLFLNIKSK